MLVNVEMPARAGILTFMSMINFVLGRVEHEKSLITSGLWKLLGIRPKFFAESIFTSEGSKIANRNPWYDEMRRIMKHHIL